MQFTKTQPVQIKIVPIPGSTLIFTFILKESKKHIKINISIIIYCKNPVHRNVVDSIGSKAISIHTSAERKAYKVSIGIPQFKNHVHSYILIQPESLHDKAFIGSINILEFSSIKIDEPIIEEIPIPRDPTTSEIIDGLIDQYDQKLPKDPKKRISYIYPVHGNDSFGIVSSNHIKYLKYKYLSNNEYIEIDEIDWSQLSSINWNEKRNVLVHPFLYPFASAESFGRNSKNFARLLSMKNKIGGFDVADSNRISGLAVELINKIDLMMVPSKFARSAYINSGVTIPVEILPHGVPDEFLKDDRIDISNNNIINLRKMKEKGNILILYFLIHSEHRKGADLVRDVMKRLQNKFKNIYLVVKGRSTPYFSGIRTVYISSWMNNADLVSLYDTCDICLSPSRGGGFELNALEAASRGLPTLVPKGCCFIDLMDYFIPVNLSKKVTQPLPGNPVHTGYGCDIDINDFEVRLVDVIDRLDYWKNRFNDNSKDVRNKYSWRNTADMLETYLKNYGFIE